MSKAIFLGGAGIVGGAALRDLIETSDVGEIVIADINFEAAQKLVGEVKGGNVIVNKTDVTNRQEMINVLKGADGFHIVVHVRAYRSESNDLYGVGEDG